MTDRIVEARTCEAPQLRLDAHHAAVLGLEHLVRVAHQVAVVVHGDPLRLWWVGDFCPNGRRSIGRDVFRDGFASCDRFASGRRLRSGCSDRSCGSTEIGPDESSAEVDVGRNAECGEHANRFCEGRRVARYERDRRVVTDHRGRFEVVEQSTVGTVLASAEQHRSRQHDHRRCQQRGPTRGDPHIVG